MSKPITPKQVFEMALKTWDNRRSIGLCTRISRLYFIEAAISYEDAQKASNCLQAYRSIAVNRFGADSSGAWWWSVSDQGTRKSFLQHLIAELNKEAKP